jgi:hypothetical protein
MTAGFKWRFTNPLKPVGVGLIGYYKWYTDHASDPSGFNQLQRGASPGGNRGDIGLVLFADARLRKWMNLSANIGYNYNSSVKADGFTLLDRPDEVLASFGVDFPVNKFFQPIAEFRTLQYVGGRTPNAFENHPMDGIVGARVFPARWFGFGAAYRYHFNQQDRDSFDSEDTFTTTVVVNCRPVIVGTGPEGGQTCTPVILRNSFSGLPQGFNPSSDPHGFILQAWIGRRDKRQAEIVNQAANVTALTLSDSEISLPCPPGFRSTSGACNDSTSISVTTTAVDPENDVLTYNYTVSGGRIVGTGASVSWDLSGVQPGSYTITAGVDDGCGICGKTETRTITIRECPDCVRECSCPSLSVSGPAGITAPGSPMTFTANVSGGTQDATLTYNWTVSAGTIDSGQGTPSITVMAPSDGTTNVTATVTLGGLDPNCNCPATASETAGVAPKPEASLVNEFGNIPADEVRAQLDAFFADLQSNPDAQGYIINYGPDRQVAARERLIRNHIAFRRFDANRITIVNGGDRGEGLKTRLYRVPAGAENPTP